MIPSTRIQHELNLFDQSSKIANREHLLGYRASGFTWSPAWSFDPWKLGGMEIK